MASIKPDSGYIKSNFCRKFLSFFLDVNALEMITYGRMGHLMQNKQTNKKQCREKPRNPSALEGCSPWGQTCADLKLLSCEAGGQSPRHDPPAMVVTSYILGGDNPFRYVPFPIFPPKLHSFLITFRKSLIRKERSGYQNLKPIIHIVQKMLQF